MDALMSFSSCVSWWSSIPRKRSMLMSLGFSASRLAFRTTLTGIKLSFLEDQEPDRDSSCQEGERRDDAPPDESLLRPRERRFEIDGNLDDLLSFGTDDDRHLVRPDANVTIPKLLSDELSVSRMKLFDRFLLLGFEFHPALLRLLPEISVFLQPEDLGFLLLEQAPEGVAVGAFELVLGDVALLGLLPAGGDGIYLLLGIQLPDREEAPRLRPRCVMPQDGAVDQADDSDSRRQTLEAHGEGGLPAREGEIASADQTILVPAHVDEPLPRVGGLSSLEGRRHEKLF